MMAAVGGCILGDIPPSMQRSTTAFGGGIVGTHQEICGAFAAGVMIASAQKGRLSVQEDDGPAYAVASAFREHFLARWGTTRCEDIRNWVRGPSGPGSCAYVVEETARLLLDTMED